MNDKLKLKLKTETAEYVCAHTKELAQLARRVGLNDLAYLLEAAVFEAEAQLPRPERMRASAALN